MHSVLELKLGLALPSIPLALLWAAFLFWRKPDRARRSAWLAMVCTSLSGIAALWGAANLATLWKRPMTDMAYERRGYFLAMAGFVAALVWFIRSRNPCAVGAMLVALWLSFIYGLYP
jgi:hypothetical protein